MQTVSLAALFSVWAIHTVAMVSPGPNMLLVTSTAARGHRRGSVFVAFGIVLAACVWSSAALWGIGTILQTSPWLVRGVRLLGGIYLVYIGALSILRMQRAGDVLAAVPVVSRGRAFWQGFLTNMTNPKSAIFFSSIFAALLPPDLPLLSRLSVVLLVVINAFCWYGALALLFSTRQVQGLYGRAQRWVDVLSGSFFILVGIRFMLSSR